MRQKELKEKMPGVAAFIEDMVKVFGQEPIHGQVRRGLAGEPTFWASENGHEIGTRDTKAMTLVSWDDRGRSYSYVLPAGATIDEHLEIQRVELQKANARVFDRRGLVEPKQESGQSSGGK